MGARSHLPPYPAIGLAAAALVAGTAGLGLCLSALRRGWTVSPRAVLTAGLITATAMALIPPFGSSDHLSYAAYGRMVITGHNPYLTTPAMLAASAILWLGRCRTGGPARRLWQPRHRRPGPGVVDRRGFRPAHRLRAVPARARRVRRHRPAAALLTRGSRARQLRAGLVWTLNPLLLQVLVAGAHVDSQAIVFAVAAIAIFALGMPIRRVRPLRVFGWPRPRAPMAGLAFAVKLSFVLVAAGLVVAALLTWWPRRHRAPFPRRRRRPGSAWYRAGCTGPAARPHPGLAPADSQGRGGRGSW